LELLTWLLLSLLWFVAFFAAAAAVPMRGASPMGQIKMDPSAPMHSKKPYASLKGGALHIRTRQQEDKHSSQTKLAQGLRGCRT
jgi:hypothetical protein